MTVESCMDQNIFSNNRVNKYLQSRCSLKTIMLIWATVLSELERQSQQTEGQGHKRRYNRNTFKKAKLFLQCIITT